MTPADGLNKLSFTFGERTTHIRFTKLSILGSPESLGLPPDALWIADENTRRFAPEDAVVLPPGESTKSWDVAHRLLTELLDRGIERRGTLVGVGAG